MNLRKVSVVFSRAPGFAPFSWLIRLAYGTSYSHVSIHWDTPWGIEVFEASGTSVRLVSQEEWKKKNKQLAGFSIFLTKDDFIQLQKDIRPLLGRPYGWRQVLGMAVALLFRMKTNPFGDGRSSFVCSELVALAMGSIFKVDILKDSDTISPNDIEQLIKYLKERRDS